MCGDIQYQDHKIYFSRPDARLPVKLRHDGVTWVIWGRRKEESTGKFPNGGWVLLDSIKMGKWKLWHPRPVMIPDENFKEKDQDKQSHLMWYSNQESVILNQLAETYWSSQSNDYE